VIKALLILRKRAFIIRSPFVFIEEEVAMTTLWIGRNDDLVERLGRLRRQEEEEEEDTNNNNEEEENDHSSTSAWTHLQFYERDFVPGDIAAIEQVIQQQAWVDVQFHQCTGVAPLIGPILFQSKVQCVSFYSCDRFREAECSQLRQVFQNVSECTVKTLLLGCIDYDEDDATTHQWVNAVALAVGEGLLASSSLTSTPCSITSLRLSSAKLVDTQAVTLLADGISQRLTSSLHTLKLPNLSLSDAHAARILNALQEQQQHSDNHHHYHPSTLSEIVLSRNRQIGTETLRALARLLSSSSSIETLDLSACGTLVQSNDSGSISAWKEFVYSLPKAATLSTIMLEEDGIDDSCLEILASILPQCRSLQRVDLGRNAIHDRGVKALARALQTEVEGEKGNFCAVVKLRLQANQFGQEGATALLEALKLNTTLEFVSIPGKLDAGKHIFHWLHLNKGGRRLMMAPNVPLGLWPHIIERVNHRINFWSPGKLNESCRINVIFHLLHGPALLMRC
jgi:hypothetical protein